MPVQYRAEGEVSIAEVNGVVFFAYPYQRHTTHQTPSGYGAWVAGFTFPPAHLWVATIWRNLLDGTGRVEVVDRREFENDKDAAFTWAAEQLKTRT